MTTEGSTLNTPEERALVVELAAQMLETAAPEELDLLGDTADEYFADPAAALSNDQRDEALGFGLDLALVTPCALAVATTVVQFLLSTVSQAMQEQSGAVATSYVRRLFHRVHLTAPDGTNPPSPTRPPGVGPAPEPGVVYRVCKIAYDRAQAVGLDAERASLLADAIAGGLSVGA